MIILLRVLTLRFLYFLVWINFLVLHLLNGKYIALISVNAHSRISEILRECSLKNFGTVSIFFINVFEDDSMNFSTTECSRKRYPNLTLYTVIWRGVHNIFGITLDFWLPSGHSDGNICSLVANLMSNMKYIIPFLFK